jgi:hypothetical protein
VSRGQRGGSPRSENGDLGIRSHEIVSSLMLCNVSYDNASLNKLSYEFSECVSLLNFRSPSHSKMADQGP